MDLEELFRKVIARLNESKIPYMLTGGLAVTIWGRPRSTMDIDVVIDLKKYHQEKVYESFHKDFYINLDEISQAIERKISFNIIDRESGGAIDFYFVKNDEYGEVRFKRRLTKKILDMKVSIITPEDLILIKLQWYKESESTKHLEDAESIFKISGEKLDRDYLTKWAKKLGVSNLLKAVNK